MRVPIPVECRIQSQPVQLPMRCGVVYCAGYERTLGGSQTCNIRLPKDYFQLSIYIIVQHIPVESPVFPGDSCILDARI